MQNILRKAREDYNRRYVGDELTQTELARRAGVTRTTIAQLEKGVTEPKVELAIKLRRILRLRSVESLFIVPTK